jgi:hypothetical protein
MNKRPKIDLEPGDGDKLLESLGWLALLLLWGIALYGYARLPAIVPTHFDGAGRVNGWGPKGTFFLLPAVGAALFAVMTILNRFPHIFNYPLPITPQNARAQYVLATRLLRCIKAAIMAIFAMLEYFIYRGAAGGGMCLGAWFLPFTLALVFVPTAYYLYQSFRAR